MLSITQLECPLFLQQNNFKITVSAIFFAIGMITLIGAILAHFQGWALTSYGMCLGGFTFCLLGIGLACCKHNVMQQEARNDGLERANNYVTDHLQISQSKREENIFLESWARGEYEWPDNFREATDEEILRHSERINNYLQIAAWYGRGNRCQRLVQLGANAHVVGPNNNNLLHLILSTPFSIVDLNWYISQIKLIINLGVDMNALNIHSQTPLDVLRSYKMLHENPDLPVYEILRSYGFKTSKELGI